MKPNNRISVLCIISLILFVGGTTDKTEGIHPNQNEDVIIHAIPYDFGEFSIFHARSYATAQWQSAVYSYLVKRMASEGGFYGPDLAADMPIVSADKLTYTFTLRDNLKFSNGHKLTARDVEFSFKATLSPEINRFNDHDSYLGFLDNVSISIINDKSLSFTFLKFTVFPYDLLSFPIVDEEHFGDRYDNCIAGVAEDCEWNAPDGSDIASAGPFKVDNIDGTDNIVSLVANPQYRNAGKVKIDKLVFKYIAESDVAINDLGDGSIDILNYNYIRRIDDLINLEGVREEFVGGPITKIAVPNGIHPMFGDGSGTPVGTWEAGIYVRQAMSHIFDRIYAVNVDLLGLGLPATTVIPPASLGWDPSLVPYEYSIEKAREKMELAGFDYTDLGPENEDESFENSFFNITLIQPDTGPLRDIWRYNFAEALPKIGIGVKDFESLDWDGLYHRTFSWEGSSPIPTYDKGGYDLLFVDYIFDLDFKPLGGWDSSGKCKSSDGGFSKRNCNNVGNFDLNETHTIIGKLVREYMTELNFEMRLSIIKEFQQEFYENLPDIPIVYPQVLWGFNSDIIGFNRGIELLLLTNAKTEWELVDKVGFSSNEKEESGGAFVPLSNIYGILGLMTMIRIYSSRRQAN